MELGVDYSRQYPRSFITVTSQHLFYLNLNSSLCSCVEEKHKGSTNEHYSYDNTSLIFSLISIRHAFLELSRQTESFTFS